MILTVNKDNEKDYKGVEKIIKNKIGDNKINDCYINI